jgi:transglutaminase superfamily protein/transglutaminase TgpA-like protein
MSGTSTPKVVWSLAVLMVGCWQLAAGWASPVAALVFAGAVVVTYGVVFGARAARVPASFAVLAVLTASVVGAYYAAPASGPMQAVVDSVPRLLTAPRPAPVTAGLLVPGVLLVAVVSLVCALSLRARSSIVPAAGGAVLYVATALLTAGQADPRGFGAVALLAVTGLGWVLVGRGRRRAAVVPQSVLVVGLAAAALGAAALLPAGRPFEPRDLVTPPVHDLPVASPLPELSSWAAAGDTELFRVRGRETPMRLIALADYTGATWRASTLYAPIGTVSRLDLPAGVRQAGSTVEVTIGRLTGPWLPTAGRPTGTSAEDAVVDASSGSMVLPTGARQGFGYTVSSTVDAPADADLLAATVPEGGAARRYLELPELPFAFAEYARRTVADARTPFEKAVAVEEVVRAGRKPNAEAPVGSSYARLETFLFGAPGVAGANEGTAEQFASAYAVLARAVGLPTRVVVGFSPVRPGADGVAVVRGADATAWPEVYFTGWGWVPFDPESGTDDGATSASRRDVINRLATPTSTPSVPAASGPPMPSRAPAHGSAAPAVSARNHWSLVLLAVPVLVFVVLGGLRAGRRARLRRAGPTGAWAYVLDSLLLAGRTPPRARPAPEIAGELADPAASRLAVLADRAAFAPDPAPAESGEAAWPLALRVRAVLRRRVPWYRRVFWAVDPRPLWRR